MPKASDTLRDIIAQNHVLQFGLSAGLFNLTRLADYLRPLIETRTKKPSSRSALLMQLSRLAGEMREQHPTSDVRVSGIRTQSNLAITTLPRGADATTEVNLIRRTAEARGLYFTSTTGDREITVITDRSLTPARRRGTHIHDHITAVAVSFHERYLDEPGFIHTLTQQLYLQNINFLEIASTRTELIFFVDDAAAKLTFATLFDRFAK